MIVRQVGCVVRTLGETILAALPGARIGNGVRVRSARGMLAGEVAALERSHVAIVPFGSLAGVAVGDRVELDESARGAPLGFAALGRALDAAGSALDSGGIFAASGCPVERIALEPRDRRTIAEPFWTGVRALDGLLTIGRGARVGFFGAPGAGKTTLLESIASDARADAVVLGLVGERGREAKPGSNAAMRARPSYAPRAIVARANEYARPTSPWRKPVCCVSADCTSC